MRFIFPVSISLSKISDNCCNMRSMPKRCIMSMRLSGFLCISLSTNLGKKGFSEKIIRYSSRIFSSLSMKGISPARIVCTFGMKVSKMGANTARNIRSLVRK